MNRLPIFRTTRKLLQRRIHIFDIPEYHTFTKKTNEELISAVKALPTEEQKLSVLEYIVSTESSNASYIQQWSSGEPGLKFKEEVIDNIHKLAPDSLYHFSKLFAYTFNKNDIQELCIKLSHHLTDFDPEQINPLMTCLLVVSSLIEANPDINFEDCIAPATIENFYNNNKDELAISHLVIVAKTLVSYNSFNDQLVYGIIKDVYERRGNLNSADFLSYTYVLLKILLSKYRTQLPEDIKQDKYYQIVDKLGKLKLAADPQAMYNPMIFTNILSIMRHLNTDLEKTNLFKFLHEVFVSIYMRGLEYPHFIYLFEAITAKAMPFSVQELDIYLNRIKAEMAYADFASQALSALVLSRLAAVDVVDYKNSNLKQFKSELEAKLSSGSIISDLRADKTVVYYLLQIAMYNSEFTDTSRKLIDILRANNMMDANLEHFCNQFVK